MIHSCSWWHIIAYSPQQHCCIWNRLSAPGWIATIISFLVGLSQRNCSLSNLFAMALGSEAHELIFHEPLQSAAAIHHSSVGLSHCFHYKTLLLWCPKLWIVSANSKICIMRSNVQQCETWLSNFCTRSQFVAEAIGFVRASAFD